MTQIPERRLGEMKVSALGFGCWAIGGPFGRPGSPAGWGEVDDAESIAAIRRGLDLGVTLFDTADVYGTGHSEEILGEALKGDRDRVKIATKFGNTFEEGTGVMTGVDLSAAYLRRACEASLRRLQTDRLDLYQCHVADLDGPEAEDVIATLEDLRRDGLIRGFGISTHMPEIAAPWVEREGCGGIQHALNVLEDAPEMLELTASHGIASLAQRPLSMGLLSGKFDASTHLPRDDVRASGAAWLTAFDADGRPRKEFLDGLATIRELLTTDGRTLAQGALGWLWARAENIIPIPGFKTVAQAQENAGALAHGPLPEQNVREIDALLARVETVGDHSGDRQR